MHEESAYAERALRAGAHGYLMKLESGEQLVDALRRLVERFANQQKDGPKKGGIIMKRPSRHFAAVVLLAVALSGCQAMTGRTAGQNVDDARISTAVQPT